MSKFAVVGVVTISLALASFISGQATRIRTINCQTQFGPCDNTYVQALSNLMGQPLLFVALPVSLPFTEIKDLRFTRQLPSTLNANLTLRRNIGALVSGSFLWVINEDGQVVAQTSQTTLPLLRVVSPPTIYSHIDDLSKQALIILSDPALAFLDHPVGQLSFSQLVISGNSDPQVILDVIRITPNWQTALQSIIARSKINGKLPKIIDLRYPSPIVTYKN